MWCVLFVLLPAVEVTNDIPLRSDAPKTTKPTSFKGVWSNQLFQIVFKIQKYLYFVYCV